MNTDIRDTFTLVTRLVQTLFSDRRAARNAVSAASRADAIADPQRVQSLAGFNKLVKDRRGWFLENENDV
jgi:hypothetical protein